MDVKSITSNDIRSALEAHFRDKDTITLLQKQISTLSQLLPKVINNEISQEDLQAVVTKDDFTPLAKALAGKRITVADKVLDFGKDNQVGDIRIRDIAGGDIQNNNTAVVISIIINEKLFEKLYRWITSRPRSYYFTTGLMCGLVVMFLWQYFRPFTTSLSSPIMLNHLITEESFESGTDNWSKLYTAEFNSEDNEISSFPDDPAFPGSMRAELTQEDALSGESSLKVIITLNRGGEYKSFISRQGSITGNSITIYVKAPDLSDISIHYIQLCVPSHNWACSYGTRLQPGEWTPITIDLGQTDKKNVALYNQKLTELAIQWKYTADRDKTFNLYFDSMLVTQSGS